MPWKETCAMDQRVELIGDWMKGEHSIKDLSELYGVSRNTIYKWISRYENEGSVGLQERSRAPGQHPNVTPLETVNAIVDAKLSHQKWAPKKVVAWLGQRYPEDRWPAPSTTGEILKKSGVGSISKEATKDSTVYAAIRAV